VIVAPAAPGFTSKLTWIAFSKLNRDIFTPQRAKTRSLDFKCVNAGKQLQQKYSLRDPFVVSVYVRCCPAAVTVAFGTTAPFWSLTVP
jgi:hypothetical protein